MNEQQEKNVLIAMQMRMSKYETVNVGVLCEIRWQAAILYAQKYYKARQERQTTKAEFNKHSALSLVSEVWHSMGFTENEVTEHMKVFTDTILRKGGTYASVGDYFREIIKTSKMYPRADGECNIVPVEVVSVGDMTEGN